ncbi:MAG: hypothetical protein M3362_07810 [Acidobacteriota bacterium]|nr:hypothetical protein [Acidobacteriota bacterium]
MATTKKSANKSSTKYSTKTASKSGADGGGNGGNGNAGGVKKTVRKEISAVFLNATLDEFLLYKLTVQGATPIFTLVDTNNNLIMSSNDAPNPPGSGTYQRVWPKPADPVSTTTVHTLGIHFLAALKYTYVVEHRVRTSAGSDLKEQLMDIDFESSTATDWVFEGLTVTTI